MLNMILPLPTVRASKPMLYKVGSFVAQSGKRESIHSGCHE